MKKISDLSAVAILVFIFWQGISLLFDYQEQNTSWFDVTEIYVDDFIEGERGSVVTYDRTISKEFTADWFVKVFSHETGINECYGKGTNRYQPGDSVTDVTLEWYVGKDCGLEPGEYTLNTIWVNEDGRSIQKFSNRFKVMSSIERNQKSG